MAGLSQWPAMVAAQFIRFGDECRALRTDKQYLAPCAVSMKSGDTTVLGQATCCYSDEISLHNAHEGKALC
jgi:hypothetical protein